MIDFFRSFFGGSSGKRTVLGNKVSVDVKEAEMIRDSNARIALLEKLAKRYKETSYGEKFKSVHEKTLKVHAYLVARKRIQELEIFHLQKTEHFINAFTVIMDVHQRHEEHIFDPAKSVPKDKMTPTYFQTLRMKMAREKKAQFDSARQQVHQVSALEAEAKPPEAARLVVPDVNLHSYSKVVYFKQTPKGLINLEIGFTSSKSDKESFLEHVAVRLGIDAKSLSYVGNALVNIPGSKLHPKTYLPLLYWNGFTYALNLSDYRLFPVKLYRKMK